tara:strand:- start:227 stop:2194 length:1968 start_codon:yes stop_codon:yes gene_type:complete
LVEFGFICWDISPLNGEYEYSSKPYSYESLYQKKRLCKQNDIYKHCPFYLCGEKKDYWKKIHVFVNDFCPDILFVFQDVWTFEPYPVQEIPCKKYIYATIHNSNNMSVYNLQYFDKIATPSQYGVNVLKSYNYSSYVIDHIVDELPVNIDINKEKQSRNIKKDDFVCLILGRNDNKRDRKSIVDQFVAFKLFLDTLTEKEKNKCKLIFHDTFGKKLQGKIDLEPIVNQLQLNEYIHITDKRNYEYQHIIGLYKISDVLLFASKSEGFGLPSVESQIYGTPVITNNCTALSTNTYFGICIDPVKSSSSCLGIYNWSDASTSEISKSIRYFYDKKYIPDKIETLECIKPIDKQRYSSNTIVHQWIDFFGIETSSDICKTLFTIVNSDSNSCKRLYKTHYQKIQKILSSNTIRIIHSPNICKYNVVFWLPTINFQFETCLLNLLTFTSITIGVQLFCSEKYKHVIECIFEKYDITNISMIIIPERHFMSQKNKNEYFFSDEFYKHMVCEKVLMLDMNTLLVKNFDESFFEYDMLGSSTKPTLDCFSYSNMFQKHTIHNISMDLTFPCIRNVIKCHIIAKHFDYKCPHSIINEDVLYNTLLIQNTSTLSIKMPPENIIQQFCMKYYDCENPYIVSNIDDYHDKTTIQKKIQYHLSNLTI